MTDGNIRRSLTPQGLLILTRLVLDGPSLTGNRNISRTKSEVGAGAAVFGRPIGKIQAWIVGQNFRGGPAFSPGFRPRLGPARGRAPSHPCPKPASRHP